MRMKDGDREEMKIMITKRENERKMVKKENKDDG